MTVMIQNYDIKRVDTELLKQLHGCSFGSTGWMMDCVDQIRQGWWYFQGIKTPVRYNRGRALVIFEGDQVVAWAFVRIPRERFRVSVYRTNWFNPTGRIRMRARGGARPDFMVFVKEGHRKKGLARKLLIGAFAVYGKVDVYPHDGPSRSFFGRNKRFCVLHDTSHTHFNRAKYASREVDA